MEGELIKSFLVGLGFDIDESSLAKFNKSITTATVRVAGLAASIQASATAIGYGISKVSEDFERMGYEYHIIAPAINKALLLRRELLKAYSAAGINISKTVGAAVKLNVSLTKTKFALEAIYKSVASRFFELLTKQSDLFRQRIYANMPKIQKILESLIHFIFKALEITTQLGLRLWSIFGRVYDFFVKLDTATNHWSTVILALIAAWKLLNLEFLATPLGLILSLGAALLTLYDDYKTFQEGGQSLINWKKLMPVIDAIKSSLSSLYDLLVDIEDILRNIGVSIYRLFKGDFSGVFDSLKTAAEGVLPSLKKVWDTIKDVSLLGVVTQGIGKYFSNPNVGQNLQNAGPGGIPYINPPGSSTSNNSNLTNQHVNQQTNININGVPDANAAGRKVLGEQGKVNFDLIRNLKGSVRPGGIAP